MEYKIEIHGKYTMKETQCISRNYRSVAYIAVKDGYIVKFFSYTITSVLKATRFQLKKFNISCNSFKEHYEQYESIYLSCVYTTKDK